MSVLIKDMKMPKACCECGFNHCSQSRDDDTCELLNKGIPQLFVLADRLPDCPLVEVPTPHGRLIDAGELEDKLDAWTRENFSFSDRYQYNLEGMIRASDFAMALPTIIEAEEGEEA